ncbi:MAG: SAP domain-containing protein [Leuconostoc carnosum]|uniref:SAP domain-containing protein n=1 Tax=Leuconostoc carnosum TaxID=1252 RepID=UPI003F967ABC
MQPLTLKQFNETYFYKTELVQLCQRYRLPTYGTKAELNNYIRLYLRGQPVNTIHPVRVAQSKSQLKLEEITLNTKLVGSGFSFNDEARQFFAHYFDVAQFSFTKEMAALKRQAETTQDTNMTVGDLISECQKLAQLKQYNQIIQRTPEEHTYQWNNFVKAFCQSPESQQFSQKLKVASILWHHVKQSKRAKKYTPDLINVYVSDIRQFHN